MGATNVQTKDNVFSLKQIISETHLYHNGVSGSHRLMCANGVFAYFCPMCWGTAKHVIPQCGVRAHIVDIVLVAQISIFLQTMSAWVWGGGVCTKKKSMGEKSLQFSSESPKHWIISCQITPPPTQLQTMTLGATVCQNAVILLAFDVHFSVSVFRIFIVFSYSTCSFALQNELANLRVMDQPLFQTGGFIFDQKVF